MRQACGVEDRLHLGARKSRKKRSVQEEGEETSRGVLPPADTGGVRLDQRGSQTYKKKRFLNMWIPQSKLTKAEKDVIYQMKLRLYSLIPDDVHAARMNHFNKGLSGDLANTTFNTALLVSASICHI